MNKKDVKMAIDILVILRKFIYEDKQFTDGLCWASRRLYHFNKLSVAQYMFFGKYLKNNRPKETVILTTFGFWWKPNIKEPRLKWIDKELKKLGHED